MVTLQNLRSDFWERYYCKEDKVLEIMKCFYSIVKNEVVKGLGIRLASNFLNKSYFRKIT